MKKQKRLKQVLGIVLIIFVVCLIMGSICFVRLALVAGGRTGFDLEQKAKETYEATNTELLLDSNRKMIKKHKNLWLKQVEAESITITSFDGLHLVAKKYTQKDVSHDWVILIHGYSGNKEQMASYAMEYYNKGYNVITPDLRAQGESEGNYIGMGWLDRKDILLWIQDILEEDIGARIVLHGVSMGGAAVMMTTGEKLPTQVVAAIEDCGYTSVWDIFAKEIKDFLKIPPFPFLNTSSLIAKIVTGYGFKEASALEQVKKSKTPTLFIHGEKDKFVPTYMVNELYQAASCEKAAFIMKDAGHARSRSTNPELYWEMVFLFLGKYGYGS